MGMQQFLLHCASETTPPVVHSAKQVPDGPQINVCLQVSQLSKSPDGSSTQPLDERHLYFLGELLELDDSLLDDELDEDELDEDDSLLDDELDEDELL